MDGLRGSGYEADLDYFFMESDASEQSDIENGAESTSSSEGLVVGSVRIIGAEVETRPHMLEGAELMMYASGAVVAGIALVYFINYYFNPSSTFYSSMSFNFNSN